MKIYRSEMEISKTQANYIATILKKGYDILYASSKSKDIDLGRRMLKESKKIKKKISQCTT